MTDTTMIPLQTTVDGVIEALWVAGGELVGRWWWVGVVVALAYYLRAFGIIYKADTDLSDGEDNQGASVAAIRVVAHWATNYAKTGVSVAAFVFGVTIAGLAWGFDIVSVVAVGLPQGDPFIWSTVSTAVVAVLTGIAQMIGLNALPLPAELLEIAEGTILRFGGVQLVFFASGIYILFVGIEMLGGRLGIDDENDRGASPPGFPGDGKKSVEEVEADEMSVSDDNSGSIWPGLK